MAVAAERPGVDLDNGDAERAQAIGIGCRLDVALDDRDAVLGGQARQCRLEQGRLARSRRTHHVDAEDAVRLQEFPDAVGVAVVLGQEVVVHLDLALTHAPLRRRSVSSATTVPCRPALRPGRRTGGRRRRPPRAATRDRSTGIGSAAAISSMSSTASSALVPRVTTWKQNVMASGTTARKAPTWRVTRTARERGPVRLQAALHLERGRVWARDISCIGAPRLFSRCAGAAPRGACPRCAGRRVPSRPPRVRARRPLPPRRRTRLLGRAGGLAAP